VSDLLEVGRDAVRRALLKGADQAEVFAARSGEARVQLESDDVSIARSDEEEGFGIRVRLRGVTGFAATNDRSAESLDEAIEAALALARVSPADPHDELCAPGEALRVESLYDPAVAEVGVDAVAQRVGELAERVRALDSRARIDSGWISLATQTAALASSTGIEVAERSSEAQALLVGMGVDGDAVGSLDYEQIAVCSLGEFEREMSQLPARFVSKVVAGLDAQPGRSFSGTLVLAPEAVAEFLLPPLVGSLSGQAVRTGKSRFKERLGEAIASDAFSLADDGSLPGRPGSRSFDREGVAPAPLSLIERGELRSFLYNTREARATGRERSTGHAFGGSTTPPGIGPSNLVVEAGGLDQKRLLEEVERGILLNRFSGNSDPVSGDFSGVAKGSFLLERGAPPAAIQETLVSGNLFDLLDAISGISRQRRWIGGSVLAPAIRIEGVSVTAG
jgi:PmbA protein